METTTKTLNKNTCRELFDKMHTEAGKFDRVEHKLSPRPDAHAILLLDRLYPSNKPLITFSRAGCIYLSINTKMLAQVANEQQIADLIRCGVSLNGETLVLYV